MSYDFYCDPSGSDNNSGSSQSTSPIWTGTVNCSGTTTLTRASGDDFTPSLVGHFVRIDPGGANDSNLRISAFVNASTLTLAENGPTVSGATANIGGAFATLQAMDDNVPAYDASGSVDADVNLYFIGTHTLSASLTLNNNGTDYVRRRLIGRGLSDWDDGSKPKIDCNTSYQVYLPASGGDDYSLIGFEVHNTTNANGLIYSEAGANDTFCYDIYAHDSTTYGMKLDINYGIALACEVEDFGSYGIWAKVASLMGCYVHDQKAGYNATGIWAKSGAFWGCTVHDCYYGFRNISATPPINCTAYDCTYGIYAENPGASHTPIAMNCLLDGSTDAVYNAKGTLLLAVKGRNGLNAQDDKYNPYPGIEDYDDTLENLSSALLDADSEWWNTGWQDGKPSSVWDNTNTSPGVHQWPHILITNNDQYSFLNKQYGQERMRNRQYG